MRRRSEIAGAVSPTRSHPLPWSEAPRARPRGHFVAAGARCPSAPPGCRGSGCPSTPRSWSRPWSCGRAGGSSRVRVSAVGHPRAGMSMGVWFVVRVPVDAPVVAPVEAGRVLCRAEDGGGCWACPVRWRETGRVNPDRRGSSAKASGARRRTPLPRVCMAPNRTIHRNATEVVVFVERSAPRPGGCVLSRQCAQNPLRCRGARSVRALTSARRARPGSHPRHGRRRSSAPTESRPARSWGSRPPRPRAGTPTRRRP